MAPYSSGPNCTASIPLARRSATRPLLPQADGAWLRAYARSAACPRCNFGVSCSAANGDGAEVWRHDRCISVLAARECGGRCGRGGRMDGALACDHQHGLLASTPNPPYFNAPALRLRYPHSALGSPCRSRGYTAIRRRGPRRRLGALLVMAAALERLRPADVASEGHRALTCSSATPTRGSRQQRRVGPPRW
jgi:hypothetical protein